MCTFEKLSKITPLLLFFLTCEANISPDIFLHNKLCWTVPALLQSFPSTDQIPHPQLARAHGSPFRSRECAVPYLVYSPRRLPGCEGVPGFSVNAAVPTAYLCTFTPQLHPQALNLNTAFEELNFPVFPHRNIQS